MHSLSICHLKTLWIPFLPVPILFTMGHNACMVLACGANRSKLTLPLSWNFWGKSDKKRSRAQRNRNEKKSFKKVGSLQKIILSFNKFRIFLETTLFWWKTNFIWKILSEHGVHRVKNHFFSKCASLSLVFFVFNWTRNFGLSVMEM